MTLKQQLAQALDQLVQVGVSPQAVGMLAVDVSFGRIESELVAVDRIGCSFLHFAFKTDRLQHATVDALKRLSESLSAKLNYLLEPISPVEIDKDACIVQLRSNPPQKDDDGTSYYELLTKRGELVLCRYNKPVGQPRQVIPANVTREVFQRLGNDFVASV